MKNAKQQKSVCSAIMAAGAAADNMVAQCRKAAQAAFDEHFEPGEPVNDQINAICALYGSHFEAAGHNVKALFKDALLLLAAPSTAISLKVKDADGNDAEKHTTAGEAIALPKHQMREAASQVREALGIGRASRGTRRATTTTPPPAGGPDFETSLQHVIDGLGSDAVRERIQQAFAAVGFTLVRTAQTFGAKGARQRGKKNAEQAPTAH